MSRDGCVALPRGTMCLSAVCDCGISLSYSLFLYTVKPILSDHSKKTKPKVLTANGSLMKVESIAECSLLEHSAMLLTCIKQ